MTADLEPLRRVAAYAVCSDHQHRVLLVRESAQSGTPGVWTLPGGAVQHGEQPERTAVREAFEETAVHPTVTRLLDVVADTRVLADRGLTIHTDRLIYEAVADDTGLGRPWSPKVAEARWMGRDEAAGVQLRPFVANVLKLPLSAEDLPPEEMPELPSFHVVAGPDGRRRVQRFATYGLVFDPAGRVLLTKIANDYPGAGRWHLPGGGTDFGEQPTEALLRELSEETGEAGRVVRLLGAASHHEPDQVGPEGFPVDWHGVRALYSVRVDDVADGSAHEQAGSTAEARWFSPADVGTLQLTEVTADVLHAHVGS